MKRVRLDQALVAKKFFDSVAKAQLAIDERKITVNGAIAVSHGYMVAPSDELLIIVAPKYVSRGGLKLEAAIREFAIEFSEKRVLDVGASTGGFTDCALQHGARQVVALDIGKNLL
ncbi:MAG: SAM-dependent methyltransferase, partial [Acidimicrobiaceae bacterium]